MCWTKRIRRSEAKPEPLTAESNIPIFKILFYNSLNGTIISPYFDFKYTLNTKYVHPLPLEIGNYIDCHTMCAFWRVNEGFHSYSTKCTVSKDIVVELLNGMVHRYDYHFLSRRVNGYIPAGAQYLLNEKGEYVSTEIVLTEIIE